MKLTWPTSQAFLAGIALVGLGALAIVMCFATVPIGNRDYMLILLGALAGALTTGGVSVRSNSTPPAQNNPGA